jgi:hypothetical protein
MHWPAGAQRTPREIYDDAKCLLTHTSTQQKNKKTKLLAFSEKTTTMKIGFSSSRAENCDEASGVQGSVCSGSGDRGGRGDFGSEVVVKDRICEGECCGFQSSWSGDWRWLDSEFIASDCSACF